MHTDMQIYVVLKTAGGSCITLSARACFRDHQWLLFESLLRAERKGENVQQKAREAILTQAGRTEEILLLCTGCLLNQLS